MKLFKTCILIIVSCIAIYGTLLLFMEGVERQERATCLKLRHQSEVYPAHLFYITQAENNMCDRIGLPVVAKVVK